MTQVNEESTKHFFNTMDEDGHLMGTYVVEFYTEATVENARVTLAIEVREWALRPEFEPEDAFNVYTDMLSGLANSGDHTKRILSVEEIVFYTIWDDSINNLTEEHYAQVK